MYDKQKKIFRPGNFAVVNARTEKVKETLVGDCTDLVSTAVFSGRCGVIFAQGVRIEGGETLVLIFDATFHSDSSLPIGLLSYQL